MTTPATVAHTEHQAPPSPRRWWVLALLCVAQLMLILDVTVVNVALPDIGVDLSLSRTSLTWVLTTYTVAFGGLMLLGGRLADLYGARRTLIVGLTIFTVASLITGLAVNSPMLLTGRAAQGIGAAILSPAALSLVTTTFTGPDRTKALGIWGAIGGGGSAIGVVLGGVLTSVAGWQWVFFINVPIGVTVALTLPRLLPTATVGVTRARLDLPGALTVTAATGTVIYGLTNAGSQGWLATSTLVPLGIAVALYAAFVVLQQSVCTPLIDLRMLTRRPIAAGALLMIVVTGLLVGSFFLSSFYLQRGLGYSALRTGLLFLPIAAAIIVGAQLASHAITHLDSRVLVAVGLTITAIGTGSAAIFSGATALIVSISVAALGMGMTLVTGITTAIGNIEPEVAGVGSGIVNTFHELGGAVGVAALSSIAAASLTGAHPGTNGYSRAFAAGALAALATAVVAVFVVPGGRPTYAATPHGH